MKRLLLLLLLVSLVFAQIQEPKLVQQLDAVVTQGGTIRVLNGDIYSIKVNVTAPQDTPHQQISMPGPTITDGEGNALVTLSNNNPPNPFSYAVQTSVRTTARTTTSIPLSYSIPDEFFVYTRPSDTVQSDDSAIRGMAEEITDSLATDFEKVAALTIWVHDNIEYDISLIGQRKDASWVLGNRRGVCVEKSGLFAALARSLGYPTRFVLGQAYGDLGWLGHAWNEIYIGEWVPVDATWLEAGHLDATHIEFFKSVESTSSQLVLAETTPGASLDVERSEFGGESGGMLVETSGIRLSEEDDSYDLSLVAESLGFGEQTLAVLSIRGSDYRIIDARLLPCRGNEGINPVSVANQKKSIVLEPNKTSYAAWVITAAEGLERNVIYTCPLTLNSAYLAERSIPLPVAHESSTSQFSALVSDSSVAAGEVVSVFVEAAPGEKVVVAGGGYMESRLASPGATQFSFVPVHTGPQPVLVAAEGGGVKELSLTVEKDSNVYVKKVDMPVRLFVGEEYSFNITLRNTAAEPEKATLKASVGSVEQLAHLTVGAETELQFLFTPAAPGNEILSIELDGAGFSDTKSFPVRVYSQPSLETGQHSIEAVGDGLRVTVPITLSDSVTRATATLAGQSVEVKSGNVTFDVEPGLYVLSVEWVDVTGESHTDVATINAVVPKKAGLGGLAVFAAAVVATLALLFLVYAAKKIWGEARASP